MWCEDFTQLLYMYKDYTTTILLLHFTIPRFLCLMKNSSKTLSDLPYILSKKAYFELFQIYIWFLLFQNSNVWQMKHFAGIFNEAKTIKLSGVLHLHFICFYDCFVFIVSLMRWHRARFFFWRPNLPFVFSENMYRSNRCIL